jgi:hypothetical protein
LGITGKTTDLFLDFATELSGGASNAIFIHVYPPGKTDRKVNPTGSRKVPLKR